MFINPQRNPEPMKQSFHILSCPSLWQPLTCAVPVDPDTFSSVITQSCPTFCDPMDCSTPGFPVHHQLLGLAQTHVHRVGDAINHLILCHPPLLLPPIFPSIRVFSNKSVLCIRWPKYWSFIFSIIPSSEHSELIIFRIDWLDFLLS